MKFCEPHYAKSFNFNSKLHVWPLKILELFISEVNTYDKYPGHAQTYQNSNNSLLTQAEVWKRIGKISAKLK